MVFSFFYRRDYRGANRGRTDYDHKNIYEPDLHAIVNIKQLSCVFVN